MMNLTSALNCIDEDLVADAISTIDNRRNSHTSAQTVNWKPAPKGHGRTIAIAVSVCCCAVILCVAIALWCVRVFTGASATDPTRDGDNFKSDTFETFYDVYPDADMAERLSGLSLDNMSYELYYTTGTDWTNADNWFSFFLNADNSNAVENDGTCQRVYIDVMFTGTIDYWMSGRTFGNGLRTVTIGDTEVTFTTNEDADTAGIESGYSFAYFEKNGAFYELTVQYGTDTMTELMSVLEQILA